MNGMQSGDESWRTIDAVQTSCNILDAIRELDGAGVTELANHLGIAKGTVHSHLSTLRQNEYVVKSGPTYQISFRFLDMGEYAKGRIRDFDVLKREIDTLAVETGEVVQFMTEEHGQGIYLYKAHGENAVETASYIGQRVPLHYTALGKSILSTFSEERVDRIIEHRGLSKQTENTITDRDILHEELEAIRERGYSTDAEEVLQGLRCLAAPLVPEDGTPIGAVSIAGPTSRMNGDRYREELPELVMSTANIIEINLAQRARK